MRTGINLATPIRASKNKRLFFLASIGFFGVCFAFAMVLLLISLVLNARYNSLADKRQRLTYDLNQQSQKKIELVTVRERLGAISKIVNFRKDINKHLVNVINLFPQQVTITTFTVTDTSVSLTANSNSLVLLKDLLENAIPRYAKDPASQISTVQESSLQLDPDTLNYSVSLDFTFNK